MVQQVYEIEGLRELDQVIERLSDQWGPKNLRGVLKGAVRDRLRPAERALRRKVASHTETGLLAHSVGRAAGTSRRGTLYAGVGYIQRRIRKITPYAGYNFYGHTGAFEFGSSPGKGSGGRFGRSQRGTKYVRQIFEEFNMAWFRDMRSDIAVRLERAVRRFVIRHGKGKLKIR